MIRLTYDLHLHSCLSPCGDDDMTPGNIVGMSAIKNLDAIALTDHNSAKNCKAFMHYGKEYDILTIPGMEVTTLEEVHAVCLFPDLKSVSEFDEYIYNKLLKIQNNEMIFGKQIIYNENDEVVGTEKNLLINSVNVSFDELYFVVKQYDGVMFPAHIDKSSNSIISNLGFIPEESQFKTVEIKDMTKLHKLKEQNVYLNECNIITNSDAHYLEHINEPVNYLYVQEKTVKSVLRALDTKCF